MNYTLKLLCQILISIILIKSIYCLMVPKAIRISLTKLGNGIVKLACDGLNGVTNSIPKPQVNTTKPNLKRVK